MGIKSEIERMEKFTEQYKKDIKRGDTVEFEWDKSRADYDALICGKNGKAYFNYDEKAEKWICTGFKAW